MVVVGAGRLEVHRLGLDREVAGNQSDAAVTIRDGQCCCPSGVHAVEILEKQNPFFFSKQLIS